jgi:hypothetical protein
MLRLKLIGPLLAVTFLGACAGLPGPAPISDFSSFEGSLEGWTARGIDLTVGGREVAWSIEPSTTTATHGTGSARLYLENFTDAGKIWLEKAFSVRPNRLYRVAIEYDFATADFGDVNLWRLIAGALPEPPRTGEALRPAFRGDTGNGSNRDVGHVWLAKRQELEVRSGEGGVLHVVLGVWGTWETPRTYFLDRVRVTVTEP